MRRRTHFNPESHRELVQFGTFYHDRRAKTDREQSHLTFVELLNEHLQITARRSLSEPLATDLYDLRGVLWYIDKPHDIYATFQEESDEEVTRFAETLFDVLMRLNVAPTIDGYIVEHDGYSDPIMVQLPIGNELAECIASGKLFFYADRSEASGSYVLYARDDTLIFGEIMLPTDNL